MDLGGQRQRIELWQDAVLTTLGGLHCIAAAGPLKVLSVTKGIASVKDASMSLAFILTADLTNNINSAAR